MNRIGWIVAILALSTMLNVSSQTAAQQKTRPRRKHGGVASIDTALQRPVTIQPKRLREGIVLDEQLGTFSLSGDRVVFRLDGQKSELRVLENLALERVWKTINDTRGRRWTVSGSITEYRGSNYLLIDRAILRAQTRAQTRTTTTKVPRVTNP